MITAQLYVGSVGVDLVATLIDTRGNVLDLRKATPITLYLRAPGETTASGKPMTVLGTGTEGKAVYTTEAGDITAAGEWLVQARVQYPADVEAGTPARDWYSGIAPLQVQETLASGAAMVLGGKKVA